MNRRGFTLIEMLVVLGIMGILAAVAIPRYQRYRMNALAAQAVADFKVVQNAAYNVYGETDVWPRTRPIRTVPPEMVEHLPGGFTFDRDEYDMLWVAIGGPSTTVEVALLAFYPTDPALGLRIANQLRQGYRTIATGSGSAVFVLMVYEIRL